MIYEFKCPDCDIVFELDRTVAERNRPAACPQCLMQATRLLVSSRLIFNTGKGSRMGSVCNSLPGPSIFIKNKYHFKEECKKHGLEPAGI